MASTRVVSAERTISAPPGAIFAILADPSRHAEIDGSGSVIGEKVASERLKLGSTFSMDMRWGVGYATRNRVVEFEEGRRIAWHHMARFVWRYDLTPVSGGTKVVESFDYSVPWGIAMIPLGIPARNRAAMARTLERLDQLITGSASNR